MDEAERRHLMESLIDEDMSLSLDKDSHIYMKALAMERLKRQKISMTGFGNSAISKKLRYF